MGWWAQEVDMGVRVLIEFCYMSAHFLERNDGATMGSRA